MLGLLPLAGSGSGASWHNSPFVSSELPTASIFCSSQHLLQQQKLPLQHSPACLKQVWRGPGCADAQGLDAAELRRCQGQVRGHRGEGHLPRGAAALCLKLVYYIQLQARQVSRRTIEFGCCYEGELPTAVWVVLHANWLRLSFACFSVTLYQ